PIGLRNKRRPAACRACPRATPPAAAGAATRDTRDGRKSWEQSLKPKVSGLKSCRACGARVFLFLLLCWRGVRALGDDRLRLRFGFLDQPQGGVAQVMKLGFARFVPGELDQIAPIQEFAQTFLLVPSQQIGAAQLVQEFLRRPFRRAEVK